MDDKFFSDEATVLLLRAQLSNLSLGPATATAE
jgi:hypothetical protein